MGGISTVTMGADAPVNLIKPKAGEQLSTEADLNVTVSEGGEQYQVSAEAQYIFEMQKYFHSLDVEEQQRAVGHFTNSNNSLDNKVADAFRKLQEWANNPIQLAPRDEEERIKAQNLLDTNLVIDGSTEIGIRPPPVGMFRLDGNQDYFASRGVTDSNLALTKQLNALEVAYGDLLPRNRDVANVFGSVELALNYSETILLSADDVLHYNYAIERARKTVAFVDAPDHVKSALTDLLSKGIAWQDTKQTKEMLNSQHYIDNPYVGAAAAESYRMGTAAQAFNQKLVGIFKSSNISILDAGSLIRRTMVEQPDLIRFTPNKIDEALQFYRADDLSYQKLLNRGFYEPQPEWVDPLSEINEQLFTASKSYALKVIGEIEGYVRNKAV